MSQQPHENPQTRADRYFTAASIGMTRWWRWVVGVIVIAVFWQGIGGLPLLTVISVCGASSMEVDSPWFVCADGKLGASLIPDFVLAFLSFVVGFIGIWIAVKCLHKKALTQVTTGRTAFDYSRFLYAALAGFCALILTTLAYRFILGVDVTLQSLDLRVYLPVVLIALVLIPIQTGFEEVFFRGYLMQGVSLLTRNRLFLAVVTAVLFTVPHLLNPEPAEYGFAIYILQIMSFGIFFALLTLLDGGIELAAGYHAINNLFLGLIANNDVSPLATPSIFVTSLSDAPLLAVYFVDIIIWVLVFVVLNMKYRLFAYPWARSANSS